MLTLTIKKTYESKHETYTNYTTTFSKYVGFDEVQIEKHSSGKIHIHLIAYGTQYEKDKVMDISFLSDLNTKIIIKKENDND